jgi:hypothetical protein
MDKRGAEITFRKITSIFMAVLVLTAIGFFMYSSWNSIWQKERQQQNIIDEAEKNGKSIYETEKIDDTFLSKFIKVVPGYKNAVEWKVDKKKLDGLYLEYLDKIIGEDYGSISDADLKWAAENMHPYVYVKFTNKERKELLDKLLKVIKDTRRNLETRYAVFVMFRDHRSEKIIPYDFQNGAVSGVYLDMYGDYGIDEYYLNVLKPGNGFPIDSNVIGSSNYLFLANDLMQEEEFYEKGDDMVDEYIATFGMSVRLNTTESEKKVRDDEYFERDRAYAYYIKGRMSYDKILKGVEGKQMLVDEMFKVWSSDNIINNAEIYRNVAFSCNRVCNKGRDSEPELFDRCVELARNTKKTIEDRAEEYTKAFNELNSLADSLELEIKEKEEERVDIVKQIQDLVGDEDPIGDEMDEMTNKRLGLEKDLKTLNERANDIDRKLRNLTSQKLELFCKKYLE